MLLALVAAAAVALAAAAEEKQVEKVEGKSTNQGKSPFDITWMNESNKKVLDNFITWYKLQLSQLVNVSLVLFWGCIFFSVCLCDYLL